MPINHWFTSEILENRLHQTDGPQHVAYACLSFRMALKFFG